MDERFHKVEDELHSLEKNETCSLVKVPTKNKALNNKWVSRVKEEIDESKRIRGSTTMKYPL